MLKGHRVCRSVFVYSFVYAMYAYRKGRIKPLGGGLRGFSEYARVIVNSYDHLKDISLFIPIPKTILYSTLFLQISNYLLDISRKMNCLYFCIGNLSALV